MYRGQRDILLEIFEASEHFDQCIEAGGYFARDMEASEHFDQCIEAGGYFARDMEVSVHFEQCIEARGIFCSRYGGQ